MATTRTVNPLHFEDLEPHRFEDLVRQLAYGFRQWTTIEAVGRLGRDEGTDIRAVERVMTGEAAPPSEDNDDAEEESWEERIWTIQCKREKTIPPSRVPSIVAASLPTDASPPYGFILAAACDLSAKARQVFRHEMRDRGIQEFLVWGKGELEDLLFQPTNDHLLFAYFDISLQVRWRSMRTVFTRRLTTKRKLVKLLGEIGSTRPEFVLLRDGAASDYPCPADRDAFEKSPYWRYFRFADHLRADHIAFVVAEYWAWADFDRKVYDLIEEFEQGYPRHPRLAFGPEPKPNEGEEKARRFWLTRVPARERATWRRIGFVHYDRILVIDEIGDRSNEPPHLLLECAEPNRLFDGMRDVIERGSAFDHSLMFPEDATRESYFPTELPEVTNEEFETALTSR